MDSCISDLELKKRPYIPLLGSLLDQLYLGGNHVTSDGDLLTNNSDGQFSLPIKRFAMSYLPSQRSSRCHRRGERQPAGIPTSFRRCATRDLIRRVLM